MGLFDKGSLLQTVAVAAGLRISSPSDPDPDPGPSAPPDPSLYPDPDPPPVSYETLDENLKLLRIFDDDSFEKSSVSKEDENLEKSFVLNEEENEESNLPQRSDSPDCTFYMRTGTCKYGSNCRFNHPPMKRNQAGKKKEKGKDEFPERAGQPECKGEKECHYYMRTGSCKFATNCRFHHPDPTSVGGSDTHSEYNNGVSFPLEEHVMSRPSHESSSERVSFPDIHRSYVPTMFSPPQGVHPSEEWNRGVSEEWNRGVHLSEEWNRRVHLSEEWNSYQNSYQARMFPSEGNIQPPFASSADSPTHRQQTTVDEFPERPGQPECQYYMKNGDCKYRSACRFHHPKTQVPKSPACVLTPMGLPLRPDQPVCTHYSRYAICKYGAACRFDHPVNYGS
ncbi:zinc finger CCCH domain-containing protein 67-like isoform X2 [Tasmannia lanceolata]|uniref:zinc finger CCCH domain-containing protein 67-like isoform X2 n=1 Tax=Tasmannia lanceolata TaxID=3420 RepID=UPI004062D597